MKIPTHILCCVAFTCFSAASTQAQNLAFWQTSVLAKLSDEEIASFRETIRETLDRSPDTHIIEWTSPDKSKVGKILPKFSYESDGLSCRRTVFQMSLSPKGDSQTKLRENYHFDICKGADGWGVYSTPITLSKQDRDGAEAFLIQVLTNQEDGLPIEWTSKNSGIKAVVVPLSYNAQGCRSAAISLIPKNGHSVHGQYQFCKAQDGQWHYRP